MSKNPPVILLVEDNKDHAELIIRSLHSRELNCDIRHVHDGSQAVDYIFQQNEYIDTEKHPRPALILMDLRMPRVDGLEVLSRIKKDTGLRNIPVVILTTSQADQDISESYSRHANSYLVKPVDFKLFKSQIIDVCTYWLKWNRLPGSSEGK